jgi:hypothetical protein
MTRPDSQSVSQTERQTDRQTDRQPDERTDGWMERQAGRRRKHEDRVKAGDSQLLYSNEPGLNIVREKSTWYIPRKTREGGELGLKRGRGEGRRVGPRFGGAALTRRGWEGTAPRGPQGWWPRGGTAPPGCPSTCASPSPAVEPHIGFSKHACECYSLSDRVSGTVRLFHTYK